MEIFSPVVGVNFRGPEAKAVITNLSVGDNSFRLEAEPENAYDVNAVKVIYLDAYETMLEGDADGVFIGYLARQNNYEVAERLREDRIEGEETKFSISVVSFESTYKPLLLVTWDDEPELDFD